jgi:hypothetical protein
MGMTNQVLHFLDQVGVYLICMCIPGFLLTFGGIRIIRSKQAISVSRGSHFSWQKPVLLKGKEAIGPGSCLTIFGVALFLLGILAIMGSLQ